MYDYRLDDGGISKSSSENEEDEDEDKNKLFKVSVCIVNVVEGTGGGRRYWRINYRVKVTFTTLR